MKVALDQTVTIRASVRDVERSLAISVLLVVLVVFFFLRNARTTFIPSVAVPVSLIGTFGVMYLCGFSVDNLSMMALTISTGFVVDDAIVVIENITRYLEQGMRPVEAALKGAEEIGSTVLTISISLVAVFIPLLLMGGIVGRLLREFAVTLSVAIGISMVISLTATPMMCAHLLKHQKVGEHGWFYRTSEAILDGMVRIYTSALRVVLRHSFITLLVLLGTIALSGYLFVRVPKGFFPVQDTGRLNGNIQADQDTSFPQLDRLLREYEGILHADPTVDTVMGFAGGGTGRATDTARVFMSLKPLGVRTETAQQIIDRLRPKLARVAGATLYLTAAQDVRVGGRQSNADYQYTMRSDNVQDLNTWGPKMLTALKTIKIIADVNTDQQNRGLETYVNYDRATAARLGISAGLIDATLYDAFGQAPVSMFTTLNQYYVVMEAAPKYWQNPDILKRIFVTSPTGQHVPLGAFSHFNNDLTALAVAHQGLFPAATISFNLLNGIALGDAVDAINAKAREVGLPSNIETFFAGTAEAYQASLSTEPVLIAAALIAVYLVLGILYESYIHPITILSTLPSAGVGALLALLLTHTALDIIGIIGIILLIGLVKKNAILMIDFAISAERQDGKNSHDAIFEACQLRFRPIMMTTMAALLGALPLALGHGMGAEMRRPLGITIIGGLIVSQSQTLFTTPVVYLYFDRLQHFVSRLRKGRTARPEPVAVDA
jgi:multidrug efflux pump subunit AcrB